MFRLVQLTDPHLSATPGGPYRGIDPDAAFQRALARAMEAHPDAVVLTGDNSEDASPESYRRLAAITKPLDCPVYWISGNHDDTETARPILESAGLEAGPVVDLGDWQMLLLDTSIPGRPEGALDEDQFETVREAGDGRPILVAMHHPPLAVGSAWIDRIALREPEKFLAAVATNPAIQVVAYGHIHQVHAATVNGTDYLSAPSTAVNSLPGRERFTPDPDCRGVGRIYDLDCNRQWKTKLLTT